MTRLARLQTGIRAIPHNSRHMDALSPHHPARQARAVARVRDVLRRQPVQCASQLSRRRTRRPSYRIPGSFRTWRLEPGVHNGNCGQKLAEKATWALEQGSPIFRYIWHYSILMSCRVSRAVNAEQYAFLDNPSSHLICNFPFDSELFGLKSVRNITRIPKP